jgi:hypothetical protein
MSTIPQDEITVIRCRGVDENLGHLSRAVVNLLPECAASKHPRLAKLRCNVRDKDAHSQGPTAHPTVYDQ